MRNSLVILTYHRVLRSPDPICPGHVLAADFDRQMSVLARYFRPMSLVQAAESLRAGRLPNRAVSVTFDDGYADNHDVALPILERHGVTATFFVATGYLDGGRMWNDVVIEAIRHANCSEIDVSDLELGCLPLDGSAAKQKAVGQLLSRLKYLPTDERRLRAEALANDLCDGPVASLMMTSKQVVGLHSAGMAIGAHTVSHPILTSVDDGTADDEIRGSKDTLERLLGSEVKAFAYPNGRPGTDYGQSHIDSVRKSGFSVAVSTAWGAARASDDSFQLPRVSAWESSRIRFGARIFRTYFLRADELVQ